MTDLDLDGARRRREMDEASRARSQNERLAAQRRSAAPIVEALTELGLQAAQAVIGARIEAQSVIFESDGPRRPATHERVEGWRIPGIPGSRLNFLSTDGFLSAIDGYYPRSASSRSRIVRGREDEFGARGLTKAVLGRLRTPSPEFGSYNEGFFIGQDGVLYVYWDDAVYDSSTMRTTRVDHALADSIEQVIREALPIEDERRTLWQRLAGR